MFLHTYLNEACDKVRCTRTHFMTKLLEDKEGSTDYAIEESARDNFSKVQEWGSGYRGLDYLFVPINIDNYHWIFLRLSTLRGGRSISTTRWDRLTPGTGEKI